MTKKEEKGMESGENREQRCCTSDELTSVKCLEHYVVQSICT